MAAERLRHWTTCCDLWRTSSTIIRLKLANSTEVPTTVRERTVSVWARPKARQTARPDRRQIPRRHRCSAADQMTSYRENPTRSRSYSSESPSKSGKVSARWRRSAISRPQADERWVPEPTERFRPAAKTATRRQPGYPTESDRVLRCAERHSSATTEAPAAQTNAATDVMSSFSDDRKRHFPFRIRRWDTTRPNIHSANSIHSASCGRWSAAIRTKTQTKQRRTDRSCR